MSRLGRRNFICLSNLEIHSTTTDCPENALKWTLPGSRTVKEMGEFKFSLRGRKEGTKYEVVLAAVSAGTLTWQLYMSTSGRQKSYGRG